MVFQSQIMSKMHMHIHQRLKKRRPGANNQPNDCSESCNMDYRCDSISVFDEALYNNHQVDGIKVLDTHSYLPEGDNSSSGELDKYLSSCDSNECTASRIIYSKK